jgi:hypothetical protein
LVLEVDGPGGTELLAGFALALDKIEAGIRVDGVFEGNRLAVSEVDGLALADADVVFVVGLFGALFGAEAAGDAFVQVDIAGLFGDLNGEIAFMPGNPGDFGESQKLDV